MSPFVIGIFGPSRSGKDEAAEWFVNECGLCYNGTTSVAISREVARREGISFQDAHNQRHERKIYWRQLGDEMRVHDPAALARIVLSDNGNLLVGVRANIELNAVIRERLTLINIWIDRPSAPFDPTMGFGPDSCDIIIPNRWGIEEYHRRLWALARILGLKSRFEGPTING